MRYYFLLQLRMLNRKLLAFGIHPYLAYPLAIVVFILFSKILFIRSEYALYIYLALTFLLINNYSSKSKLEFLKINFRAKSYSQVIIMEKLLMVLPFSIFLLYEKFYLAAVILLFCGTLSAFILPIKDMQKSIPTPFYKRPFEFTVGFRKSFMAFILLAIILVISIKVENLNLGLFILFIIPLIASSYYARLEDSFFIWIFATDAKTFLHKKMMIALKYLCLLALPGTFMMSICYSQALLLIIGVQLLAFLYILMFLLVKYANVPSEISLPQSLMIIAGFVLPPLLLILIPYFYIQSKNKLQYYL